MPKGKETKKQTPKPRKRKQISELDGQIEQKLIHYQDFKESRLCFPFLGVSISPDVVEDIFQDLEEKYKDCNGILNVLIHSSGGDIDAAYNLAMLFRKYGTSELNFIVPRWAKSAATLLACAGDNIIMSRVAELGPLDPQITQLNPLEGRLEQFSPLHIESTLDMIRNEYSGGSEKLADKLMERLQFPLTLGGFIKTHQIAQQYLVKLLQTRMLSDNKEKAEGIAKDLTTGYASHGFCINIDEAKNLGLNVVELEGEELKIVWEIYKLHKKKQELQNKEREKEVLKKIKDLPPELLDKLRIPLKEEEEKERIQTTKEVK